MGSKPSSSDMRPGASAHDRAEVASYKRKVGSQIGKRPAGGIGKGSAAIKAKRKRSQPASTGKSKYRRKVR